MNPLNLLFNGITSIIQNHASPNTPGPAYDPSGLLNQLGGLFGQHAEQHGQQFDNNGGQFGNVLSSDQDPYGDPGTQQFGNVKSSDEDPYGDPGRQR